MGYVWSGNGENLGRACVLGDLVHWLGFGMVTHDLDFWLNLGIGRLWNMFNRSFRRCLKLKFGA